MGIVTPCDSIFRITLPAGKSDIVVNGDLPATTTFVYVLIDKFGNIYSKSFTTDGAGSFTLLNADFPVGLFTPYSGSFTLQVKRSLTYARPEDFIFCSLMYDTIQIDFSNYPESAVPGSVIDCK